MTLPALEGPLVDHGCGWRHIVASSTDVVLVVAADGTLLWVSRGAGRLATSWPEGVIGTSAWSFVHPGDTPRVRAHFDEVLHSATRRDPVEFRLTTKGFAWAWVEARIVNLTHDARIGGLVVYLHDISHRRSLLEELAVSERRYRRIVEASDGGIAIVDVYGTITFANRRLGQLVGVRDGDLIGASVLDYIDADDVARVTGCIGREVPEPERLRLRLRDSSGRLLHVGVAVLPFERDDTDAPTTLLMVRDDTERNQFELDVRNASLHDAQTGLPNRILLIEEIHRLTTGLRPGQQAALLLLDLDRFSAINDAIGTPAGDAVLATIATRLIHEADREDLVARVGGDEFAIICPSVTTEAQARVRASSLQQLVSAPMVAGEETLRLTASIGVSMSGVGDADAIFRSATMALTTAKGSGHQGTHVVTSQPAHVRVDEWRLESELRAAIGSNQLTLHYQPIVDMASRQFIGAEALMRWTSPLRGPVPPDQFIPLAEKAGLIQELGAWALRQACLDAMAWPVRSDGHRPTVSVNVSAVQLAEDTLPATILQSLMDAGLDASNLVLEVTETGVLADMDQAVAALAQLQQLGVRVYIDDFGTGYASLLYMRHFPVEGLKIDRTFVSGLGKSKEDTAIVNSTISLARATGLCVVAEGVETEEQAELLQQGGCSSAQGYLYSHPLTQGEWLALLDTQTKPPTRRRPRVATAAAVGRILELHGAGASVTTIAAALNRERMPAPGKAVRWHRSSVAAVLGRLLGPSTA
ncbi:MAG: hypothetical protein JWM02_746 [Frankiales bacterium]|nr:hypothetical protein [Frankiales bacterium]